MNILSTKSQSIGHCLLIVVGLLFVLLVNGAIPFFATPTLGQAVWVSGFAQSFLNNSLLSIKALNFGVPEPAPIAFGLTGAWPVAVFMSLGLHAADAYSLVVALWLSVAFISAYKLGRFFAVTPSLAILAAVAWGTMPMIWAHASYSMLSTGIALLPFYFLAAIYLFLGYSPDATIIKIGSFKLFYPYLFVCLIAIFMDGYSFMMFAVGASILGGYFVLTDESDRKNRAGQFAFHLISLAIAYVAYTSYMGKLQFSVSPIDFFRGWGADITFFLQPTRGVHWLPDLTGWSTPRSGSEYFGDASVWRTTFSVLLMIGGILSIFYAKTKRIKVPLVLVALFGFYMALGPSFKFNSTKPIDENVGQLMSEKYALAPTGTAILSEYLPGFNNMRACYRWAALGAFATWLLVLLALSRENKKYIKIAATICLSLVIIFNSPNLSDRVTADANHRSMFFALDKDIVNEMQGLLHPHERVAFLPWRNDFLVNYVASKLDIQAYNIGGDKNLRKARKHWPETLRQFPMWHPDPDFADRILTLFANNEVDAVVLPYMDMLWAAHRWPYPIEFAEKLLPIENQLADTGLVSIEKRKYYSVLRLNSEHSRAELMTVALSRHSNQNAPFLFLDSPPPKNAKIAAY